MHFQWGIHQGLREVHPQMAEAHPKRQRLVLLRMHHEEVLRPMVRRHPKRQEEVPKRQEEEGPKRQEEGGPRHLRQDHQDIHKEEGALQSQEARQRVRPLQSLERLQQAWEEEDKSLGDEPQGYLRRQEVHHPVHRWEEDHPMHR